MVGTSDEADDSAPLVDIRCTSVVWGADVNVVSIGGDVSATNGVGDGERPVVTGTDVGTRVVAAVEGTAVVCKATVVRVLTILVRRVVSAATVVATVLVVDATLVD